MVAASTFLSHLGASRSRCSRSEWPSDFQLVRRRDHLRLDAQCPVAYTVTNQSDSGSAGLTGKGRRATSARAGSSSSFNRARRWSPRATSSRSRVALGPGAVTAEAEVIRIEEMTELGPGGRPKAAAPGVGPTTLVAMRFTSISEGRRTESCATSSRCSRRRRDRGEQSRRISIARRGPAARRAWAQLVFGGSVVDPRHPDHHGLAQQGRERRGAVRRLGSASISAQKTYSSARPGWVGTPGATG